jgi:hypothetical protein
VVRVSSGTPGGDPTVSPALARCVGSCVGNHLTNGDRQDRLGDTSGIAVMNETLYIRPWVVDQDVKCDRGEFKTLTLWFASSVLGA